MGLWSKEQLRQFIKENKLVTAQDAQNALNRWIDWESAGVARDLCAAVSVFLIQPGLINWKRNSRAKIRSEYLIFARLSGEL